MALHNDIGASGEAQAAFFLYKKGWEIIARNHDHPAGQIDIIAKEGETYVFVEVKSREGTGWGALESRLARKQQKRIVCSAMLWLKRKGGHPPCRFDLIVVERGEIRHHRNAFRDERYFY